MNYIASLDKRSRVILAVLIFAAFGGAVWLLTGPSEPTYHGEKLSRWLAGYSQPVQPGGPPDGAMSADRAVRALGTNAIPTLLDCLNVNESPLARRLIEFGLEFSLTPNGIRDRIDQFAQARSTRREWALRGLRALGPEAKRAVPSLAELSEGYPTQVDRSVFETLAAIGPAASAAVPRMLARLHDDNARTRMAVLGVLVEIGATPETVVPKALECLHDQDKGVRGEALICLGKLGPAAKTAVPSLLEFLSFATNASLRVWAFETLGQIQAEPEIVLPGLLVALRDPDPVVVQSVARSLGGFGPAASAAAPRLVEILQTGKDVIGKGDVILALGRIRAEPKTVVPLFVRLLGDPLYSMHRRIIAESLGDFGADGIAAVPALIELLEDRDHAVQMTAKAALQKVAPGETQSRLAE